MAVAGVSKTSILWEFQLLFVSRLLKGIRGVAVALIKRERLITSLQRIKGQKKYQKTLEDECDHENMLVFQLYECHVSLRAFFFPVASDVASNYLQCHKQIDV